MISTDRLSFLSKAPRHFSKKLSISKALRLTVRIIQIAFSIRIKTIRNYNMRRK